MTEVDVRPSGLEELAAALADLHPVGDWVAGAACAGMGEVFAPNLKPGVEELSVAERCCRRCPVRLECAAYADSTTVYGFWGGRWYSAGEVRQRAA